MFKAMKDHIAKELESIRQAGTWKEERVIVSPQGARIAVAGGKQVLNFCANNYLGLGNDPRVVRAARESYDKWGYGLSSVRFICGTQQLHKRARGAPQRVSRHGGHDPLLFLLRRQRRTVRDAAGRARTRSSATS